jgi:hypothetical protein
MLKTLTVTTGNFDSENLVSIFFDQEHKGVNGVDEIG